MTLTDTHAHLCDAAFADDLPAVLERASAAGVGRVVAVGESLADAHRNLELATAHPETVRPAAGLFPTRLDLDEADALVTLMRSTAGSWAAVGEVGLDHWKVKDEAGRELQREIFRRFIVLARELDLPLNVHSRSAGRQTIDWLLAHGATRVQMHAFDGRAAKARAGLEAGYLFSVPPSILRSRQKQKLVRQLPLESLLLESDSPVLGPDPEHRNEPANVRVAVTAIASIKGVSEDEVMAVAAENTRRLYARPAPAEPPRAT